MSPETPHFEPGDRVKVDIDGLPAFGWYLEPSPGDRCLVALLGVRELPDWPNALGGDVVVLPVHRVQPDEWGS